MDRETRRRLNVLRRGAVEPDSSQTGAWYIKSVVAAGGDDALVEASHIISCLQEHERQLWLQLTAACTLRNGDAPQVGFGSEQEVAKSCPEASGVTASAPANTLPTEDALK